MKTSQPDILDGSKKEITRGFIFAPTELQVADSSHEFRYVFVSDAWCQGRLPYVFLTMCLGHLYPAGGAMSVATCRRYYARIRNGWYLSICSRLRRDLHSRVPRGLEAIQTQIASATRDYSYPVQFPALVQ